MKYRIPDPLAEAELGDEAYGEQQPRRFQLEDQRSKADGGGDLKIRPTRTVLMLSAMTPRSRRLILRRRSLEKSVAMVMNPSPPIWMSSSTMACPKPDQYVAVSTRTRPVTQEALTEVKSAVTKPVASPLRDEAGSMSSIVPPR